MIINIRGTNGSGKTTLARALLGGNYEPVDLVHYEAEGRKQADGTRSMVQRTVEGCVSDAIGLDIVAVGKYRETGCGGLDTIKSFELQQRAVIAAHERFTPNAVVCEGVLASTVAGSWLSFFEHAERQLGLTTVVAYLDTPLDECLRRIRKRQEEAGRVREIKEQLVGDKMVAIERTRRKFDARGIRTITVDHRDPLNSLRNQVWGDQ